MLSTKQRALVEVVITKKNCLQAFADSMRVISAIKGNPPLGWTGCQVNFEISCFGDSVQSVMKNVRRFSNIQFFGL